MVKPTVLSLSAFFLAAAMTLPALAQQDPTASSTPNASQKSARPVVLPVAVRDKKGELVTNLQKSDLSLTQDGRPQTIDSLTRDTSQPARIGLLVDTSKTVMGALDAERKAAGSFVDQVLPSDANGSKDQAFLIHFDREVELLEDFTSSRDKLHTELENMEPTSGRKSDDSQGPETTGDDRPRENNRHGGDQLYDAIFLAADELMKSKDGRKALVIFSNGADHGSKDTMNDAVDAADRAGLTIYTIFFKGQPERTYGSDNFPGNRRGGGWPGGGGGGYPGGGGGYPGGGGRRQPEPTSASGVDGKKIMQEIATRTGGHAYEAKHTSDLEPIYKLIADELHAQYLLTYTPDKPDEDNSFHKVSLSANNKDWTVSAREGYYPPEGK